MVAPALDEHGGREFHAFPAFFDPGAQEQRPEMLFYGSWADVQMARDFLVAAPLHQQVQHLLVSGCDLDLVEINHWLLVRSLGSILGSRPADYRSNPFAKYSPQAIPHSYSNLRSTLGFRSRPISPIS